MAETENSSAERGSRKVRVGTVLSDKMEKTVIVGVERKVAHRLYGKQVTRTKKYFAHDEDGQARQGDVVRIVETKPLSKQKRWRLIEIVEKAK
jgi:small subunit ribosomal protein S17